MFSPAGSWLAQVERPSGTVEIGLHFTRDGLVFLVSGASGAGLWRLRQKIIWYRVREPIIDNGDYRGYIDILQYGEVKDGRLGSSGQSRVYGADGLLLRAVAIRINAVPRSPASLSGCG
jgi:hypothetical protein